VTSKISEAGNNMQGRPTTTWTPLTSDVTVAAEEKPTTFSREMGG
jgi:hypothetical protein